MGIAGLGNPVFMGIQNFLAPRIARFYARSGIQGFTRFIFRTSAVLAASMSCFLLVLMVYGEDLLGMVYSQKYSGNGEIIAALGLNLAIISIGFSSSRALFAMSRSDLECTANILSLSLLIIIGYFLVKTFGLPGAACALIISSSISSLLKCVSFTFLVRRTSREVSNGKWCSSPQN
jgi:O-antigen/teichoic acid export membrane protein